MSYMCLFFLKNPGVNNQRKTSQRKLLSIVLLFFFKERNVNYISTDVFFSEFGILKISKITRDTIGIFHM